MPTDARRRDGGERSEVWSEVCVIGSGPRGLSLLERLTASAGRLRARGARLRVHLVDPRPGSGHVWRSDQSEQLLMNTVTSQVTLFTDDSVRMEGPVVPGPSLHAWAADPHARAQSGLPAGEAGPGADGYPTRALFGRYLEWVLRSLVRRGTAEIVTHAARAVRLDDEPDGRQRVRLENGTVLGGLDAVVLAQGHLPVSPTPGEAALTSFARNRGLLHLPPGNPADAVLDGIEPGENVLLRGLGLNFCDYAALLTVGRGGVFEPKGAGLVYHRSGREPVLYAGSRRGVPYQARGENEKGAHGRHTPLLLTPRTIARLRGGPGTPRPSFRRDIWPLVAQEVETVYYTTLLRRQGRPAAADAFLRAASAGPWTDGARDGLLDALGVEPGRRWDWEALAHPCGGRSFADLGDFNSWLLDHLRRDVAEAHEGNVSNPYKAALDVLRDLRNEVRLLVDHGGISGADYRDELLGRYTPLNAYTSIGPPARRIAETIALIEAGVLTVLGPGARFGADEASGRFSAGSPRVGGDPVTARVLVEARLPEPDLARTEDPLLGYLRDTGQCTEYVIDDEHRPLRTGGVAVTERPYRLLDASGAAHPRRFAYGVPTEGVHWVTAAGARPGVDSVILGDSDAMARSILALAALPGEPAGARAVGQTPAAAQTPAGPPDPQPDPDPCLESLTRSM
ncbi:FAD/NAD(P)-binding protein [Streptomyces sp. NPDC020858]|uniref:FAD/NAD(P)-binding protein n=1 Tax=Streptomyces sp. NPDC020858 TaxID=3365097 RepID=UPI0037BB129C